MICNDESKIQSKRSRSSSFVRAFQKTEMYRFSKWSISNKSFIHYPRTDRTSINGRGLNGGLLVSNEMDNSIWLMCRLAPGLDKPNLPYALRRCWHINLTRSLQNVQTKAPLRKTNPKRASLWPFMNINTVRRQIVQRAGRLIRPQGRLVLSMSANAAVKKDMLQILDALKGAA